MFSPNDISKLVQDNLNTGNVTIPDGHTKAFIVHSDVTGQVTALYAQKINNEWQVNGIFDWGKDEGVKAGFNLEWSK